MDTIYQSVMERGFKLGVKDETRAMQTALITEMINYMKKINSITI